jgi:hypothetical protein
MSGKRKYVPLNVKTYREGFLRLQGWTVFCCIAFFTAGLLVNYEVNYITRQRMQALAQHALLLLTAHPARHRH